MKSAPDSLRPFRAGVRFSFFNAIAWQIALGAPMVLYAEELGASTAIVGLVYSFVFLLAPLEVVGSTFLPRFGFKRQLMFCWAARSVFLLPLVWLAAQKPEGGSLGAIGLFVGCYFLFCVFRSWGNSCFAPWMYSILPDNRIGAYFGSIQAAVGLSSIATLFVCALLFHWFDPYTALLCEFGLAFVGSTLSLLAIARLKDGPRPKPNRFADGLKIVRRYVLTPSPYRYFLLLHLLQVICVSSLPPFVAYYLKVQQALPSSTILSLVTLQSMGVMAGAYFVKHAIDKSGPRSIFLIALNLLGFVGTVWLTVLNGWFGGFGVYALCYVAMGLAGCLWFSATMNYLPMLLERDDRPLMLAVNSSIVSILSGLAPIAWGWLLKATGPSGAPSINLLWFNLYFAFLVGFSLLLIPLFMRIRTERFHQGEEWTYGAELLRPFRAITYLPRISAVKSEPNEESE